MVTHDSVNHSSNPSPQHHTNGVRSTTCHVHRFLLGFALLTVVEKSAPKNRSVAHGVAVSVLHQRRPLDHVPVVTRILFDDLAVLEVAFGDHLL